MKTIVVTSLIHDHFTSSTMLTCNFNIFYAFLFQQVLQEL